MIHILSSWVKQIIFVVVFVTVVDFILPNQNYLRYARVLLGLVLMISIINPLLGLFHKENFFNKSQINYSNVLNQEEIIKKTSDIKEINNELLVRQYKNNLISVIKNYINNRTEFEVKNIDLKIIEQNERNDFGKIVSLDILLKTTSEMTESKDNIQKVSVRVDEAQSPNGGNPLNYQDDLLELKRYIQSEFDVPDKKIQIRLEGE